MKEMKRPAKSIKKSKKNAGPVPGTASVDRSGNLVVHCGGCDQVPDAGSPVCVRCIASAVSSEGTAEKIRLKAGRDTEISGGAAEILCDLALLRRASLPTNGTRKCSVCSRSPVKVMGDAWADFPEPSFAAACDRLYALADDSPECTACLQRTHTALRAAEDSMARVKDKASKLASGKGAA